MGNFDLPMLEAEKLPFLYKNSHFLLLKLVLPSCELLELLGSKVDP